jgi:glucose/arabinose dehydrogenase
LLLAGVILLVAAQPALATAPSAPTITEPSADGKVLNPADVHMEASGFSDPDGDTHACSDWEIWTVSPSEPVWQAPCQDGLLKVHIHLGDGTFVNSHAGRTELEYDTQYRLRVRFIDSAGEASAWSQRPFSTIVPGPPGTPAAIPWAVRQPGYEVQVVATGFQLPVNVVPVPNAGTGPSDPLMYITELYGKIKVVRRDGTVSDYATGLLNFDPTGEFPGSGEQGVAGLAVDPASGDVFASMNYEDTASTDDPKPHYGKVVRLHSKDGGLTAASQKTIFDAYGEPSGPSHQISNLTIGPDGYLYVHNGDGFDPPTAENLDLFRGKVLRMDLTGTPPSDNPFYDSSDGITARDYVFAYGFRNPFGGAWRSADGAHYEVEAGPSVDRFAKVVSGGDYGFDGTDASMSTNALYNWDPAHAPVNIAFVEPQTSLGSGFPTPKMDHAYVTESGPTFATGPQVRGKRIVEFAPGAGGTFDGSTPQTLVEYTGVGKATAVGIAPGPDGLYFTDLYKDVDYASASDPGANLLRVRWTGDLTPPGVTLDTPALGHDPTPTLSGAAGDEPSDAGTVTVRIWSGGTASGTPLQTIDVARSGASWSVDSQQLDDGTYTAQVEQSDTRDNTGTATRSFIVDTRAPDTTIEAGPDGDGTSSSAALSFDSDDPGASFQCRLDGGEFAACVSPYEYSELAAGRHTFEVRAIDAAGNVDPTPATWNWTVPPSLSIPAFASICRTRGGLPDRRCTPGARDSRVTPRTVTRTICRRGWSSRVGPSSTLTRRLQVERELAYGIASPHPRPSRVEELDRLVPLDLGGAPLSVANLWPQPVAGRWGARTKNRLERRLRALVCERRIGLRTAQRAIARNWISAYRRYVSARSRG